MGLEDEGCRGLVHWDVRRDEEKLDGSDLAHNIPVVASSRNQAVFLRCSIPLILIVEDRLIVSHSWHRLP
jgi:hypothetical protein